jgi:small-conductance mechanosensitive channel/CRP-like cAMP-binding protein
MNLSTGMVWAAAFIVLMPIVVLLATELEERLRQRESPLRRPVVLARNWALPAFALWALFVPVLDIDTHSPVVVAVASWFLVAVTVVVLATLRVLIESVRNRSARGDRQSVPQLLLALPRIVVYLVAGWILIAGIWGIDLSAALTALGVTSLVISFALQDTLSGLASGVLLLGDQPFQTGDWIRSGDTEGVVVDINWRTSRIRNRNGDVTVVPNSELATGSIVNYTEGGSLHRVVMPVQVAYLNPPTLAKEMLLDAARGTPNVLTLPPPGVRVIQVDDPLMTYEVDMWIGDFADEPRVKSDFGSLVWYQSHRHGVPLPSPAQDLYLYDGPTASAADIPTPSELRASLTGSPYLESLPDDEIDRMAHHATAQRFARGELIIGPAADQRDLMVLVAGAAELILISTTNADEITITTVNDGDLIGPLGGERVPGFDLALRAVSDCEMIAVDADTASEVGSRNAELATALDRMATTRRRRSDRILEGRVMFTIEPERNGSDTGSDSASDAARPDESAPTGSGE